MKRKEASNTYVLVLVSEAIQPGNAMRAQVYAGRDLEAARREAIAILKNDSDVSRVTVLDEKCVHLLGVVTRSSPDWQVPENFPLWREAWH